MWYPFVKQEQNDDCGYACLAMLIEYYHQQKLTIGEVKHHFQNYQGALSVYSLSQIANEYNLVLTAFEISKQELSTLTFEQPSAEKGHWVLIDDFMIKFQAVIIFNKKRKKFTYKTRLHPKK